MVACGLRGYGACKAAKTACMRSCLRAWVPVAERGAAIPKLISSTATSSKSALPARNLSSSRSVPKKSSVQLKALSWNVLANKFSASTCATNLFAAHARDNCNPTSLVDEGSVGVSKLVPIPGKDIGTPGSLPNDGQMTEYWRWPHRFELVKEELIAHGECDLIVLQEVDMFEDIRSFLSKKGFGGLFGKKCPMGNMGGNTATDGCAIFYRTSTLKPVGEVHVAPLHVGGGIHIALFQRFVAVCGKGKRESAGGADDGSFLVVATHLKAGDPLDLGTTTAAKVRVQQSEELLKLVEVRKKHPGEPVVVFGDWNAHSELLPSETVPENPEDGIIQEDKTDNLNAESAAEVQTGVTPTLRPWFSAGFRSAYDLPCTAEEVVYEDDDDENGEGKQKDSNFSYWSYSRAGSTKTDVALSEMKLRVDHVLFSGDRVSVKSRLALPSDKLIAPFAARLPNQFYPSDHVSLGVEFDLQL